MSQYTPMMQQYLDIKKQAQDAFLFFRLGDFYELFFDDAVLAAKELEITLTGKNGGPPERIPMCGVPYHSAEGYIHRLIEKGYKVAICEQVEDPATAKGIVKREIIRVVTPGTMMESKALSDKANNYMICVTELDGKMALAACDLSTGELHVTSSPASQEWLRDELGLYEPSEIIGQVELVDEAYRQAAQFGRKILYTPWEKQREQLARQQFGEAAWARLDEERQACVALLIAYLSETQKRSLGQLTAINAYEPENYMILDPFTRRNLELVETVRERSRKGTLLWLLDRTETPMGGRMLRRWIDKPLLSKRLVEERLEAVDKLHQGLILREDLKGQLKGIYDLERLVGRMAFGTANGRDMLALRDSLLRIPELRLLCADSPSSTLGQIAAQLDECSDLAQAISSAIVDDPPISVREGNLIRKGYHAHLDELREASVNGKRWIAELEAAEREATGIRSLKIGYNKVFGYYIEVTRSNLAQLPEGRYERKQTLANAERYVTPELKEKEALILEAQEKMVDIEYELFSELRNRISAQVARLKLLAEKVAEIDVYQSFATVSAERGFVKPSLSEQYDLRIRDGRHPVVEAVMNNTNFISNSTDITETGANILLITGPNMAGKSTYMRQVALLSIMAQIGCFVPAGAAEIPMVDRIFTRIGAADDLIGGQSTFMVEMADIQVMTERATRRSLIIIDELGRGTSTSEGMAIAQAVIEYVHHEIGCKALVSTHFHELAHLEETLEHLSNFSMAVRESGDKVHFLRKLVPGAASSSYGIYCAQLAGLPGSIISRANVLLERMEQAATTTVVAESDTTIVTTLQGKERSLNGAIDVREDTANYERVTASREQVAVLDMPETPYNDQVAESVAERTIVQHEQSAMQVEQQTAQQQQQEIVQLSIFGEEDVKPARVKEDPLTKQIISQIQGADLMNMTPLQAMQLLNELKMKTMRA
ncbi:DNA mismatch repair protein MutS [Paenibacillus campi]|uniref:DNA mismatch repair protein MutS n=1 Tax=Paenibacillus campi TaxID=3106031 RepID=UPI002AFEC73A|nr:DNA mismatch repair protein MutS [Paenibacillus sp. SGZ-1009]